MVSSKADTVIGWIPHGLVRVHFDATRHDVLVPKHLRKQTNVVFEWGFNMARSILGLKIDQDAISGRLSFSGYGVHRCMIRWPAVFCVASPTLNKIEVWPNDAPADVQRELVKFAMNAQTRRCSDTDCES